MTFINNFLGKGFQDKIKYIFIAKILKAFYEGKCTHVAMIITFVQ